MTGKGTKVENKGEPRYRSRKGKRRTQVRTGTRTLTRYEKARASKPKCARCEKELAGTARGHRSEVKKLAKSQKRPSREFAGTLCGICVREMEIYRVRMEDGTAIGRDLTIEKFLGKDWQNELIKGGKVV